jgi:hypothetical protein
MFVGAVPHQAGVLCTPASRPTTLATSGATNLIVMPTAPVGVAVALALFIVAIVLGAAWVVFKQRGNTLPALRALCCGSAASYTETA